MCRSGPQPKPPLARRASERSRALLPNRFIGLRSYPNSGHRRVRPRPPDEQGDHEKRDDGDAGRYRCGLLRVARIRGGSRGWGAAPGASLAHYASTPTRTLAGRAARADVRGCALVLERTRLPRVAERRRAHARAAAGCGRHLIAVEGRRDRATRLSVDAAARVPAAARAGHGPHETSASSRCATSSPACTTAAASSSMRARC